jgi:hypothetical protein
MKKEAIIKEVWNLEGVWYKGFFIPKGLKKKLINYYKMEAKIKELEERINELEKNYLKQSQVVKQQDERNLLIDFVSWWNGEHSISSRIALKHVDRFLRIPNK